MQGMTHKTKYHYLCKDIHCEIPIKCVIEVFHIINFNDRIDRISDIGICYKLFSVEPTF
jgi:hypothetical protein